MYYRQAKKRRFMNGVEDRLTIYVSNFVLPSTSHGLLLASLCNHTINPLNPELNPICYLLALLAHHFLHVSRIRVKSLTLRLLM